MVRLAFPLLTARETKPSPQKQCLTRVLGVPFHETRVLSPREGWGQGRGDSLVDSTTTSPTPCRVPWGMRRLGRPGRAQLLCRAILSLLVGAENQFKKLQAGLKGAPGPVLLWASHRCTPQQADCRKNRKYTESCKLQYFIMTELLTPSPQSLCFTQQRR